MKVPARPGTCGFCDSVARGWIDDGLGGGIYLCDRHLPLRLSAMRLRLACEELAAVFVEALAAPFKKRKASR